VGVRFAHWLAFFLKSRSYIVAKQYVIKLSLTNHCGADVYSYLKASS
jgi:hypothetical protein